MILAAFKKEVREDVAKEVEVQVRAAKKELKEEVQKEVLKQVRVAAVAEEAVETRQQRNCGECLTGKTLLGRR